MNVQTFFLSSINWWYGITAKFVYYMDMKIFIFRKIRYLKSLVTQLGIVTNSLVIQAIITCHLKSNKPLCRSIVLGFIKIHQIVLGGPGLGPLAW